MVVRQGTFTQKVVNAWNGLPGKVVAAETVDKFKLEQVKSFNTARMVKQMSTLMLKYAIYAFSVEKQLKSVLNI